jgi:pyruvate/2-oxoacid:ferredoxin oxidoreductase alpha subunit
LRESKGRREKKGERGEKKGLIRIKLFWPKNKKEVHLKQ